MRDLKNGIHSGFTQSATKIEQIDTVIEPDDIGEETVRKP